MSSSLLPALPRICGVCHCRYEEPRILPCLHTFCTNCLKSLEPFSPEINFADSSDNLSLILSQSSVHGSASGYESEKSSLVSTSSLRLNRKEKCDIFLCPTCSKRVEMPREGVKKLPLNYMLLHEMIVDAMNLDPNAVFCDLCTSETIANDHCMDCLLNLCNFCSEAHNRQKKTYNHKVIALEEAIKQGICISRKPVLCLIHPTEEIHYFCTSCLEVLCNSCSVIHNQNHKFDTIKNTAEKQINILEALISQTRSNIELLSKSIEKIQDTNVKLKIRVTNITEEVNKFIDGYMIALEMHRQHLLRQIQRVYVGRQRVLRLQRMNVERVLEDLNNWEIFVNKLINEGTNSEILSIFSLVTQCLKDIAQTKVPLEPRTNEKIEFIPRELGGVVDGYMLQGQLLLQAVSPHHCLLKGNGLQVARQDHLSRLLLVVRDVNSQPVIRGCDDVSAKLVSKDDEKKQIPVTITDRKDGSYVLTFSPDTHGQYFFHVQIGGNHIKGSPFLVNIKPPWRKHFGIYHCCTFCSSNGNKEAQCACGGTIPGGFRGCGHGHVGHPGGYHWSCCGKMSENSECARTDHKIYECTL
ncbi:E3 ubiquitin-protein ligase TRIM45-like [Centruroides vittatus]|uniref:E3 ubiquitin-protein ligase TRIM45-like n=1 Tax=Centruroides vittatus TaxID=120091 RepID=UPI0035105AB7